MCVYETIILFMGDERNLFQISSAGSARSERWEKRRERLRTEFGFAVAEKCSGCGALAARVVVGDGRPSKIFVPKASSGR